MKKYLLTLFITILVSTTATAQLSKYFSWLGDEQGVTTYRSNNGNSSFEIKSKGTIEATSDDRGIKSITPDGFLGFSKTTFGNERSILIESDSRGKLSYEYYVGKKRTDFIPEGKRWMEDVLIEVIRRSGISAEERVRRFYARGGVNSVLNEIEEIESSSVKGTYFGHLMAVGRMNNRELTTVAHKIGTTISSSSTRGSLYRKYGNEFLSNNESGRAYFEGLSRISSSSERGSTIRKVLKEIDLNDEMLIDLLDATDKISSSSEKGSILRGFTSNYLDNPQVVQKYFTVLSHVSSTSEKGSVLRHAIKENFTNDERVMDAFFNAVDGISSSSEKGSVLRNLLEDNRINERNAERFFQSVGKISSSTEQGSILRKTGNLVNQSSRISDAYFSILKNISSTTEKGSTIRTLIKGGELSSNSIHHILDITKSSISSTTEKGSILRSLLEYAKLSDRDYIQLFETVKSISSSTEKGSVLRAAVKVMPRSSSVVDAFKDAVSSISSDSEYRSVMNAFNGGRSVEE